MRSNRGAHERRQPNAKAPISAKRHPDRHPGKHAAHGYDWFALGGVLINQEEEPEARRPGYNHRYKEKYANERWSLCKTAFNIAVERAAKYATGVGCRLRVSPERCNKPEDAILRGYYNDLKTKGMPFAADSSQKYGPLSPKEFQEILYEFKPKAKSSPLAQLADLYLWPLCMGGRHASNRPYRRLKDDGRLIECILPEEAWEELGTKYSCFDLVERRP